MRNFFACTTLFLILFIATKGYSEPLRGQEITPAHDIFDDQPLQGGKWFSCSVQGTMSNGDKAVIVANSFKVADDELQATKHEVITQFYFSAKQANMGVYEQMVNRGGFYADCKVRDNEAPANNLTMNTIRTATKQNIKVLKLSNFQFSSEALKQYRSRIGRYAK